MQETLIWIVRMKFINNSRTIFGFIWHFVVEYNLTVTTINYKIHTGAKGKIKFAIYSDNK